MSKLKLRLFDGARLPFGTGVDVLITVMDGNQKVVHQADHKVGVIAFDDLRFYNNNADNHSVVAYAKGYRQAGFYPVKLTDAYETTLDIMLVPDDPGFSFAAAKWDHAISRYPFLARGADAKQRWDALLEKDLPFASMLNLCEAMRGIHLAQGTPLDYFKQVRWDKDPAQDRFFAYCDPSLVDQVRTAANRGLFAPEFAPHVFHRGATHSWKQVQFGEANVQLTFHENAEDQLEIEGLQCVTVEPDIDYYKDPGAHALLEVAVNGIGHLTDPVDVYVLRWIAGRHAGLPEFAPLFTLTT